MFVLTLLPPYATTLWHAVPLLMNDEWVFRAQGIWRAASQGAQLDVTAHTGHSGQTSSTVLNQSRRINVWEKYSSLYNLQWAGLGNTKRPIPLWHLHLCRVGVMCGQMVSCDSSIWHPPALCRCKCLHQALSSVMVPRAGSGCLQFNCAYFTLELLQGFAPESPARECEGRIWAGHHSGVSSQLSEGCSALVGSGKHTSCSYSRYKWGRIRAVK